MTWFLLLAAPAAAGFGDGTLIAGLTTLAGDTAAWGDFDADGDPDLWDGVALWRNDDGIFVPAGAGLPAGRGLFGDVDNDGDLDLYAFSTDARLHRYELDSGWTEVVGALSATGIVQSEAASLGDLDGDGLLDLYIGAYEGNGYEPDVIYLGEGDGSFLRWWEEPPSGTHTPYIKPGRGVSSCDFDEDGDLDVYVSNYRLEPNSLWVNDGSAAFDEAATAHGVAGIDDGWEYSYGHTIGSCWGDLDNDGDFDLFVGNFSHPDAYQDRPQVLENLGAAAGWVFQDRSSDAALAWQESFASPALGDYDNDGDLDVYYSTVYAGDYPVLLRNDGSFHLTDVTAEAGLSGLASTYQAAWADFDRDGDLDLVSAGSLWVNDGNDNHWLGLTLVGNGLTTNTMAVGAQVRIHRDHDVLTRQVEGGTGNGNQHEPTLHFGLGTTSGPVDLEVRWPDGSVEVVAGVAVDQYRVIEQCGDKDGDGAWSADCGGDDCDDSNPDVGPHALETWYDGVDQDCQGDGDYDADGDGWDWGKGDCDDRDGAIHPEAPETWYDGVDSDCGLDSDYDADRDGFDTVEYGGTDCNDQDGAVHPGADEVWYDGVDQDCRADSDHDADWDGYDAAEHGGTDCDDTDIRIHPGAAEVVGNGIDEDCDGADRGLAPEPEQHGCTTGGAADAPALLLLALLAAARRTPEPHVVAE